MISTPVIAGLLFCLFVLILLKCAVVVPQQAVIIIERLGRFNGELESGFHLLVPFVDRIAYRRSLKEVAIDVPTQTCITKDNVSVEVDGVLYLKVVSAKSSCYGIENYEFGVSQLAQTTLRSTIGTMDLDTVFEERANINAEVVKAVDEASNAWGVKVLRYEIRDITPPKSILAAMEKQLQAEREKRAVIATSEGQKQATINAAGAERATFIAQSEGKKQAEQNAADAASYAAEKRSEGERQARINLAEAEGQAMERVGLATARAIASIAEEMNKPGGIEAANLYLGEQWVTEFGKIAKESTSVIIPQNLADISGVLATATRTLRKINLPKTE